VNDSEVEFVFDPAREQAAGYDDAAIAYVGSSYTPDRPRGGRDLCIQWHPPAGSRASDSRRGLTASRAGAGQTSLVAG